MRRGEDTAPYLVFGAIAVLPAQGDESDGDGVEEFSAIQAMRDAGHRIDVSGELNALIEFAGADLRE